MLKLGVEFSPEEYQRIAKFDDLISAAEIIINTHRGTGPKKLNIANKEAAMATAVRYLAQTLSRLNGSDNPCQNTTNPRSSRPRTP